MQTEMEYISDSLGSAETLQEIFGNFVGSHKDTVKAIRKTFLNLSKATHPDTHGSDPLSKETFTKLTELYNLAVQAAGDGKWGTKIPVPGREKILIAGKYERDRLLFKGDIADIHYGMALPQSHKDKIAPIVIKAARHSQDNDLLLAEKTNTDKVREVMLDKGAPSWPQCFPEVLDSFLLSSPGGKRRINIQNYFAGYLSLAEISKRIPAGLDGRTIVWMWKRLIVMLDWTYNAGIVHGAVLPPHVMFYPDNDGQTTRDPRKHSIRLSDWCYSVDTKVRSKLSSWVPQYKEFYAPEILNKEPLGHSTDVYMAAKVILSMCDKTVPKELTASISRWVEKKPSKRPKETLEYFQEFLQTQQAVYGKPKWHDLIVPGGPAQL
jgi:hypothetical protein